MKKKLLTFMFVSFTMFYWLPIQSQNFYLVTENFNSIDDGNSSAPAFADIDGDGLMDMVVGVLNGSLHHYEQDAVNSSNFISVASGINSIDVGAYATPAFCDLDGDALLDLLIGEENGNINHYEQNAFNSYNFDHISNSFNSIDVGMWSVPTINDINGDGLLDMLIGKYIGEIHHYVQDAANSVSFSLVTTAFNSIDVGTHSAPALVDLYGNGIMDLIIGEEDGSLNHYIQNSLNSMAFSLNIENFNFIDVGMESKPAFTDINGNGFLDLFIGEYQGNLNHWRSFFFTINMACVVTTDPPQINTTSTILGGNVTDGNSHLITKRGVCYSQVNTSPTLADMQESMGSGLGVFSGTVTGLTREQHIFVHFAVAHSEHFMEKYRHLRHILFRKLHY